MTRRVRWSEDETKRALYLYFQLPFGQIHSKNPEIIALGDAVGRTPSSIAMKLANFASLDPKIRETGRKGLEGASELDRKVWAQFHEDWTRLILDVGDRADAQPQPLGTTVREMPKPYLYELPTGPTTTRAEIEKRIGQDFFRRAVFANFDNTCCVTGIADRRLLNASHISPWKIDIRNRHNPRNGLCLSATFDRAFDRNLMTVTPDLIVRLSSQLLNSSSPETRTYFAGHEGKRLNAPTHLMPDPLFLQAHNYCFLS